MLQIKKWEHISNNCTEPNILVTDSNSVTGGHGGLQGLHLVQTNLLFARGEKHSVIKDTWMLLYVASTESVTSNELLITDVLQYLSDDVVIVISSGGSQVFDKAGMLTFMYLRMYVNKY